MRRYVSAGAMLLAAIVFPFTSFGACTNDNVIRDPEPFQWTDAGDHSFGMMEIVEADLTIGNDTITTRVYTQPDMEPCIPGPTMIMEPGRKYVLQFRNRLPYEPKSEEHNVFKDPNVSNLHTHGLHISGMSPGDDVTRSFEGGAGGDFVYDIPANHMGGTFWYHAHHHGSTYLQVSGGAFGLIVIDDSNDDIPAPVAAMTERQLVIAYLDPDVAGTGGDTLITGSLSPTWTVNGKINGDLLMPSNEWQHFRILLADRDAKEKTLSIGTACDMELLARDGVWRTTAPKALSGNDIVLTGASRADIAVRCAGNSTINVGGQTVANIITGAPGTNNANPWSGTGDGLWSAKRPAYLQDLRGAVPDNFETVNMGARTINGAKFDHHVPTFTLDANGVQQFTLKGARNHPFHLHIYHVQVQGNCGSFEDGEYYDVISGNCDIRFDLSPSAQPYDGRTIMHCHILEHEDQGAMGWADVINGVYGPPEFPDGDYTDYIDPVITPGDPPVKPTGLIAVAASTSQIDLSWDDNPDETGYQVQHSPDGGSYTTIGFAGQDSPSYSDSGLGANTTHFYRVIADNDHGESLPSDPASATTLDAQTGGVLQVGSIQVSVTGRKQQRLRAVVVIRDDSSNLVQNAVVTGSFAGTLNEVVTGDPTDSNGSTTLDTSGRTRETNIMFEFCVTSVTHPDLLDINVPHGSICKNYPAP